jgi:hypothetical protein
MVINSIPSGLCLSGNLPKLDLSAEADVRICLLDAQEVILDETYTPGFSGRIALDISELIHDALAFTMPDAGADIFIQPALAKTFTLLLNDDAHTFTAVRTGINGWKHTPGRFLEKNFLTAQEQTKYVTADQPEWLTYYAQQNAYLYITAKTAGWPPQYIKITDTPAGKAITVNMRFNRLAALCTRRPDTIAACVFAADSHTAARLTNIQHYKLIPGTVASSYRHITTSSHQIFAFENSLGGLDTLRCTGEAKAAPEYTPNTALINDAESAYRVDKKDTKTQNTGWLSKEATLWIQDFFAARKTYILENDNWRPIILDENPTAETSTHEDLAAFEFSYRPATSDAFLPPARQDDAFATWDDFINIWKQRMLGFSDGFSNGFEI